MNIKERHTIVRRQCPTLFLALALGLTIADVSSTKGQALVGRPTNIASTSNGMISERFQKHSWFTSDGSFDVLIRATQTVPALKIYRAVNSRFTNFVSERQFKGSGGKSTSAGVLINDRLYLVYDTDAGQIVFAVLKYASSTWTLKSSSVLNQGASSIAARPSLAVEPSGRIWVGYTLENGKGIYSFHVDASNDGGQSWTASNAQLPTPAATQERSIRLITGPTSVYAIYSDSNTFGLSLRQDSTADPSSGWTNHGIFFTWSTSMLDPHGSHFSAVTDLSGNLHFLSNNGNLSGIYMRYGTYWSSPVIFSSTKSQIRAAYMELATDQKAKLVAIFSAANPGTQCLASFESPDDGGTWQEGPLLTPGHSETKNARVETPDLLSSFQPVLQQVLVSPGHQSAVSYVIEP
jgi:hypothetical protein